MQQQSELLPPEEEQQEAKVEIQPLRIDTPLEQFKNLFDRLADIRSKVILWEKNTVIKDAKTRDEAIALRTTVTRTAKFIEDTRKALQKPVQEYIKEMNGYAAKATEALTGTKENPMVGVAGRLTQKISEYAAECKRLEEELKRKALAEQKRIEDELAAKKAEEDAREQARQLEENLRLEAIEKEALEKAQAEGQTETDQMAADIAREEERARIEQDRVAREKAAKDREIADQKARDEAQQKMVAEMAKATSQGKVKGVKEIWSIELMDESLLDKKFMVFDESKARKFLDGGFYDKKEKDPEKIIPGLRCLVVLGKGGR